MIIERTNSVQIDSTNTSNRPPVQVVQSKTCSQKGRTANRTTTTTNKEKDKHFVAKNGFALSSEPTHAVVEHPSFKPELKERVANFSTIEDFFNFLFNESIINKLTDYTNKRLLALRNEKITLISPVEIRGFIGLLLLLGLLKKNDVDVSSIWDKESLHYVHWAAASFSRDRFKLICRYLTLDDVDKRHVRVSKTFKVSEIFEIYQSNCFQALEPGSDICVDEQLYSFRGRCPIKQYMPSKPAKYGIKFWSVVDTQTKYLLKSFVYQGKSDQTTPKAVKLGENVVQKLVEPYYGKLKI